MKYLKYFENIDSQQEPEIKVGQQWIKKDKSEVCHILKINPDTEIRNIQILQKGNRGLKLDVDKKSILDNYTLIENKKYNDIELSFYKTTYIPEDKAVIGAYFITEKTDTSIKILNAKE